MQKMVDIPFGVSTATVKSYWVIDRVVSGVEPYDWSGFQYTMRDTGPDDLCATPEDALVAELESWDYEKYPRGVHHTLLGEQWVHVYGPATPKRLAYRLAEDIDGLLLQGQISSNKGACLDVLSRKLEEGLDELGEELTLPQEPVLMDILVRYSPREAQEVLQRRCPAIFEAMTREGLSW